MENILKNNLKTFGLQSVDAASLPGLGIARSNILHVLVDYLLVLHCTSTGVAVGTGYLQSL